MKGTDGEEEVDAGGDEKWKGTACEEDGTVGKNWRGKAGGVESPSVVDVVVVGVGVPGVDGM